jgi:hypothetical protein
MGAAGAEGRTMRRDRPPAPGWPGFACGPGCSGSFRPRSAAGHTFVDRGPAEEQGFGCRPSPSGGYRLRRGTLPLAAAQGRSARQGVQAVHARVRIDRHLRKFEEVARGIENGLVPIPLLRHYAAMRDAVPRDGRRLVWLVRQCEGSMKLERARCSLGQGAPRRAPPMGSRPRYSQARGLSP